MDFCKTIQDNNQSDKMIFPDFSSMAGRFFRIYHLTNCGWLL